MAYLIVNQNNEFRIFSRIPYRKKEEITITSDTEFEWDYHGHHSYLEVPTGEYREYWCRDIGEWRGEDRGILIDKLNLSNKLQSMTWKDEPIEI